MPYVIATKRSGLVHDSEGQESPYEATLSRRAVATLEEAREYGVSQVQEHRNSHADSQRIDAAIWQIEHYPITKGTIGPLPDGTVIEIEQWDEQPMRAWMHFYGPGPKDAPEIEILDAYNARQS